MKRTGSYRDRQRTDVVLIDKGKKIYRKIQGDYSWSLQESLERSLTPVEQETFARLLGKSAREILARSVVWNSQIRLQDKIEDYSSSFHKKFIVACCSSVSLREAFTHLGFFVST